MGSDVGYFAVSAIINLGQVSGKPLSMTVDTFDENRKPEQIRHSQQIYLTLTLTLTLQVT